MYIDSIAFVPLLAHSMLICIGTFGAGSNWLVTGLIQSTWPVNRWGVFASIHNLSGALRVMKVGALSSSSSRQSLSKSQSLDSAPL